MKTQAVRLIALRPFLHGYTVLAVGDAIVTTPGHAKQLLHLGHAREAVASAPVVDASLDELKASAAAPGNPGADAPALQVTDAAAVPGAEAGVGADVAPASQTGTDGLASGASAENAAVLQMDLAGGAVSASDSDGTAAAAKPAGRARRQAG